MFLSSRDNTISLEKWSKMSLPHSECINILSYSLGMSHVPVGNDSPCCKGCVVCWHFFITQTSSCVKTPLIPTFLCTEDASSCRSSHIHARRLSVYFCALFLTIAILLQNPPYFFILIGLLAFHHGTLLWLTSSLHPPHEISLTASLSLFPLFSCYLPSCATFCTWTRIWIFFSFIFFYLLAAHCGYWSLFALFLVVCSVEV